MKKERGNVGELMAVGLCILALAVMLFSYLDSARLLQDKMQIGQLARKYILRMETVGRLEDGDRARLYQELLDMGVTQIQLDGSTLLPVGYGEEIVLEISGKIEGQYEFTERRMSTAKY